MRIRPPRSKGSGAVVGVVVAAVLALLPGAAAGRPPQDDARIDGYPAISGTAEVGQVLTATARWSPDDATASWMWFRCADTDFESCRRIPGASTATYPLGDADVGQRLRAFLTVVAPGGHSRAWAYSATTGEVAARPVVTPAPTPAPAPPPVVTPVPRLMRPAPVVRIRGWLTRTGARVTLLTVRAPHGARVRIRCLGTTCPRRRWAQATALVHVVPFERRLRAGTRLLITVTKPGAIGKYTLLVVRRGRPPARVDRCLYPGSSRPRRCPPA